MTNLSTLRTIRTTRLANRDAARTTHQATIDACVANYSHAAWDAIEVTEIASRNALAALEAIDSEIEHAELVNVQVRKA